MPLISLADYITIDLALFLQSTKRDDALWELIDALKRAGKLVDREAFARAIFAREKLVSTGIGLSVAIPHAKLEGYDDFFIAVGIQKTQGIPWQSIDNQPVRFVFMIGGPDGRQTEYLGLLSQITALMKSEERRKKLLHTYGPSEIVELLLWT